MISNALLNMKTEILDTPKLYQFEIHIFNSLIEESIATKCLFKNKKSRSALYTIHGRDRQASSVHAMTVGSSQQEGSKLET